jgi:hypothetical protein
MLTLKRWPATGAPADDGLVIVDPAGRATVLVVPSGARTADIQELDMGMPMALYRAQIEAAQRGFQVIYVAPGEEAQWNPEWGVLID